MAKSGRLEKEIGKHLYAINELLLSAKTTELSSFARRINELSDTNCGWVLFWARPLLSNLLEDARLWRRKHGIFKS